MNKNFKSSLTQVSNNDKAYKNGLTLDLSESSSSLANYSQASLSSFLEEENPKVKAALADERKNILEERKRSLIAKAIKLSKNSSRMSIKFEALVKELKYKNSSAYPELNEYKEQSTNPDFINLKNLFLIEDIVGSGALNLFSSPDDSRGARRARNCCSSATSSSDNASSWTSSTT